MELPDIIRLSTAIIDRHARLIVEWDTHEAGKIWIDNGTATKYFYTGEDARIVWDFYHPEKPGRWLDKE